MNKVEIGMTRHVWGEHAEFRIGEDGDGLGLVRLRMFEKGQPDTKREILMTPEEADAVAAQLGTIAEWIRTHSK